MVETLFPYILLVHIATASSIVVLILWTDKYIFTWIRGNISYLDFKKIKRVHYSMWLGLSIMIATGTLLFYPYKDFLQDLPAFQLKIGFVITLIINSFYIDTVMHHAQEKLYSELSNTTKIKFLTAGIVSGLSWVGTITAAFMLNL